MAVAFSVELRPEGPYLPALGLHLDPVAKTARAFVSHAHVDPFAPTAGGLLLLSRETVVLHEARGRDVSGATPMQWSTPVDLPLAGGRGVRAFVVPAGHVLGAAQLVLDHPGGRLVYTGHFSPRGGRTRPAGSPVPCDDLVIEPSFGLPIFRFPDRERTIGDIVRYCEERLAAGESVALLADAASDAQELVHALLERRLPATADAEVWEMSAAYERIGAVLGVADGRLSRSPRDASGSSPAVVVLPLLEQRTGRKARRMRTVLVSGSALLDAAAEQRRADAAFALSDLADYDELVALVRATGARRVTTTGAHAGPFASVLRDLGIGATALEGRRDTTASARPPPEES